MLLSNLLKVNTSSYVMGSIVILNVCTDNRTDSDEFSLCGFRNVKDSTLTGLWRKETVV